MNVNNDIDLNKFVNITDSIFLINLENQSMKKDIKLLE